jgi:hypothetical protein
MFKYSPVKLAVSILFIVFPAIIYVLDRAVAGNAPCLENACVATSFFGCCGFVNKYEVKMTLYIIALVSVVWLVGMIVNFFQAKNKKI